MRLLIIGSYDGHVTEASQIAIKRGAKVAQVETIDHALSALRSGNGADLALIDVALPVRSFIDNLERERISLPVAAYGLGSDADAAVRAIKAGAKEYIPLPPDPEMIAAVLEAVTEEASDLIHADPATKRVIQLADQIAPSDASVLITGESGTGKELMARHIHLKSKRAGSKFVSLNCAAIPENLLESELFGHEKGAFSGAIARRIGKFEEANGGTLLLDEISEMDLRLQAKLLRAIQEREIDRVGGSAPVKVDIRVLATTNRDLEEEVRAGRFREDLMFRLNVVTIRLPALRERPADIPVLSKHFIEKYSAANGVPVKPLAESAATRLLDHAWRGNVRELENTMHRAVLLAGGDEIDNSALILTGEEGNLAALNSATAEAASGIGPALPHDADDGAGSSLVNRTVADVERELILNTLEHCLGNRTHAANILGISIRTLRNKLKQYSDEGIAVPMPGGSEAVSAGL